MASSRRLPAARSAFTFVLTMGVVNLFADMTYEGGASINGQYLGSLGASAAAVSIIARRPAAVQETALHDSSTSRSSAYRCNCVRPLNVREANPNVATD